ncbi:transcription regulator protein BACH1a [Salminus brasiliensis]|uniref:transcription regulator protein BACH1a n=1 Tax=Salminus brasiliensis TaxID=930266 RepID=UPI003B839D05
MSVDGPRTSVFTFQSAVHSVHVLRSLDEQRQKDVLCDVTVEVECRSFRAHRSVLACCSDYFYTRLLNNTGWNVVINLPDEVTVEGFVPLLQFAYTAKLHFTKENILEIHRCAELLGFHNLDKACFEFLIPKFSDGSGNTQEAKRKSKNSNKSKACHEKPPAANEDCSTTSECRTNTETDSVPQVSGAEMVNSVPAMPSIPCPEECPSVSPNKDLHFLPAVSFQPGSDQDRTELCLQNCGPQLSLSSLVPAGQVCPFLSVTCTNNGANVHPTTAGCDGDILQMGEAFQNGLSMDVSLGVPGETSASETLNMPNITEGHFNHPVRVLEPSAECSQLRPLSPTETSEVLDSIASVTNLESINSEAPQTFDSDEQIFPDQAPSGGSTERSTVEREVAEHLAKGFWPDLSSSLAEPLESMDQAAVGNGSDFHWLKHLDLGAAPDDCPFLRDLSSKEGQPSGGDSLSKEESRESSCVSPVNSGENSECDTEGDCAAVGEQVCEVELPFPVEHISSMSRRAFLQMLKEQALTPEQLEFVQDVRRRSKNRMAAQRCRKRKLDCIYRLEGDIKKLRTQKEKLLQERKQLKQNMEEMRQSVSGLCQIACPEASAQPEQLNILARYLSSDCPTSLPLTPMACPGLAASDQDNLPETCLEASVTGQSPNDCPQGNGAGNKPTSALFQDDTQSDVAEPHVP